MEEQQSEAAVEQQVKRPCRLLDSAVLDKPFVFPSFSDPREFPMSTFSKYECSKNNCEYAICHDEKLVISSDRANNDQIMPLLLRKCNEKLMSDIYDLLTGKLKYTRGIGIEQARGIAITGIPGCGKTMSAWTVVKKLVSSGYRCVWYNVTTKYLIYLEPIPSNDISNTKSHKATVWNNIEDIESTLEGRQVHFYVMDEVIQEAMCYKQMAKIISTSPLLLILSRQFEFEFLRWHCNGFHMSPWTVDEYMEACMDDTFFESVFTNLKDAGDDVTLEECLLDPDLRKSLIVRKFPIAGVSARWMFDINTDTVVKEICHALDKLGSKSLVSEEKRLDAFSPYYMHSLIYLSGPNELAFLSDAVVRIVIQRSGQAAFMTFVNNKSGNKIIHPTFNGILLEIDFINAMASKNIKNKLFNVIRVNGIATLTPIAHTVFACVRFHKDVLTETDNVNYALNHLLEHPVCTVFIPKEPTPGGFALVHVVECSANILTMVFYQVARQVPNRIRINYLYAFLDSYNQYAPLTKRITNMKVRVIVPSDSYHTYHEPFPREVIHDNVVLSRRQTEIIPRSLITINYELATFIRPVHI